MLAENGGELGKERQLASEGDDVVGGDQRQPAIAKSGQQVAMELRAVEIERPVAALARRCLRPELGKPAARDLGEDVSLGESGKSPSWPALWRSSRCCTASRSVAASTVRKRARPSTPTQTAYFPFGCW